MYTLFFFNLNNDFVFLSTTKKALMLVKPVLNILKVLVLWWFIEQTSVNETDN